jgi:hypothetical protein
VLPRLLLEREALNRVGYGGGCEQPACSSPPSVALCPRVAVRSPMSGASLAATKADGRFIDERARPSCVVRRGRLRCGMLVGAAKTASSASRLIREQK